MVETDSRSRGRELHQQAIYELLFDGGPSTRTDLARRASLSKPSVSAIIDTLVDAGIVVSTGSTQGRSGPAAAIFEIRPGAAHAIGVDLGGTKVHAVLGDLSGRMLAERRVPTDPQGGRRVVEQIATLCRALRAELGPDAGEVNHVAVGSPGIVDPVTGLMRLAYNLPGFDRVDLATELENELGVAVHVDNDVNMAAEGERFDGSTTRSDNFAYVSVGTGIGMAVVLDGHVCRGHRGAAGEIAYLPLGADPFHPDNQVRGPLEEAVDGNAILARFARLREQGGQTVLDAHADVPAIFEAASAGDPLAVEVVDEEARLIALAVVAIRAMLDPERVILGGGIGSAPALLPAVRSWCARLMTEPVLIERTKLGTRAPLVGALGVALTATRADLLDVRLRGRAPRRIAGHHRSSRPQPYSGNRLKGRADGMAPPVA